MHIFFNLKKFLFTLTCLSTFNAFSWWDQSHQLIGFTAGRNVSSKTYQKVIKILHTPVHSLGNSKLSANTSAFDTASSWADSIKFYDTKAINAFNSCHYIGLEMKEGMAGRIVDETTAQHALNLARQEYKISSLTCVKSAVKTLADPTQTIEQNAIALRFLMHIIGDMAEPLHNFYTIHNNIKDYGAHKTDFSETVWIPMSDGSSLPYTALHSLWDGSLGYYLQFSYKKESFKKGRFAKSDRARTKYYSDALESQTNSQKIRNSILISNQSVEDWIMDSFQIAVKDVYIDLYASWPTYSEPRFKIVTSQIAKGSYRLAFLLNAIFDPENAPESFKILVSSIKNDQTIKPLWEAVKDYDVRYGNRSRK